MPAIPSRIADWCAHSFWFDQREWLVFCNTASLYPVFASAERVTDAETLFRRLAGMVSFVLRENRFAGHATRFERQLKEVQWASIPGPSVLGSMSEMIWQADPWLDEPDLDPAKLSRRLGITPMGTLGMADPATVFRSLKK